MFLNYFNHVIRSPQQHSPVLNLAQQIAVPDFFGLGQLVLICPGQ